MESKKYICPCDKDKPLKSISVSTQCLCEEVEYQKELTFYFFDIIMRCVCLKTDNSITSSNLVSTPSTASMETNNAKFAKNQTTRKDIRNLMPSDVKNTLYGAGGNQLILKKNEQSPVAKVLNKTKKGGGKRKHSSSLQPITEDVIHEWGTEKLLSTSDFENDWLVKRDEKVATIVFKNGHMYEGEVVDKVPHGYGVFQWECGAIYEGQFKYGTPTGKGRMQLQDLTEYTGTFYNGYFHGNGVYNIRHSNMVYSGGWKYGKKHGNGWLLYKPGLWYEGEFKDDLRHGKGFSQFNNGSCYEGTYTNNRRNGNGAMRWANNDVYIGQWLNGEIDGFGEYTWDAIFDSSFSFPVQHYYKGSWAKGKRTGAGVMYFGNENGAKLAGIFQNNFKHGAAIVVCGNGVSIEKNPLFENDKPINIMPSTEDLQKRHISENRERQMSNMVPKLSLEPIWNKTSQQFQANALPLREMKQQISVCNPLEIQIHSPPDDIELSFYINLAINMNFFAIDVIQFDNDSQASSDSNLNFLTLSKTNLMSSSFQQLRRNELSTIKPGCTSYNQPFLTSDTKLKAVLKNEDKFMKNVIMRHLPKLMEVYYYYATITTSKKEYYKHYMVRIFLWQLYMDIGITELGISLVDLDVLLYQNPSSYLETCHHPFEHIYFFQFIQSLVGASIKIYDGSRVENYDEGLTPYIFQKFLSERLFVYAGSHKGRCLFEYRDVFPIKNVYALYLKLGEPHTARKFLNYVCTKKGEEFPCHKIWPENKNQLKNMPLGHNINSVGHNFLYIPEQCELGEVPEEPLAEFDEFQPFIHDLDTFRMLGPQVVTRCLYTICPLIRQDGFICNMDYAMTFLEFYEVLLCCVLLSIAKIAKIKEFTEKAKELKVDEEEEIEGKAKMKKKKNFT